MAKIKYVQSEYFKDYSTLECLKANMSTGSDFNNKLQTVNVDTRSILWLWVKSTDPNTGKETTDFNWGGANAVNSEVSAYNAAINNIKGQYSKITNIYNKLKDLNTALGAAKDYIRSYDSAITGIFGLDELAEQLNSKLDLSSFGGDARFVVGVDDKGKEEIVLELRDSDGNVKVYKVSDLTNGFMVLTGAQMSAQVLLGVDATEEERINAVLTVDGTLERAMDMGLFSVTSTEEALTIWQELYPDNQDIQTATTVEEVYEALNIEAPSGESLGYTPSSIGENVFISSGLVTIIGDIVGAYDINEETGEKEYNFGKEIDMENVEFGKDIEGPIGLEDRQDYEDVKEKIRQGQSVEEAIESVNDERRQELLDNPEYDENGERIYDKDVKTTKAGDNLGKNNEEPTDPKQEVLGDEETTSDPTSQQTIGGDGGSGGNGGSGGGNYGYMSGGSDDYTQPEPTSAIPEGAGGGDQYTGTTGRTPITDIIPESTPSTETLEANLNESTNTGFDFGSKDYDELALEEYSSAGAQVKAAGILAAVAEANELFDTNPTQLYSRLQQMGYNDKQINDIMSDRELTKQAFANNKQREDLAKIAEDKAKADGNNNYKSQYSDKEKSIDDINKERDLINSNPECANAKNELDTAINEYKTAVEEANSALTEAKTLKAELDNFTNENGTDVDAMTDEQYNKYTELANKYNKAVDDANKKIETVSQTKENCIKAQEKYDAAKLKARELLNEQTKQSEPITPENQQTQESIGASDTDLLNDITGTNETNIEVPKGNETSTLYTGNSNNSEGGTIFGATSSATMNIEEPNSLGLNVTVPTAQNVLESSTDLPTVTMPTSSDVIGASAPITEVNMPGNFVKDSTGISDNEILASVAIEDAENQKSKLNHIEQASGIGLVGLGAVALARNASDKKEISNMIKEHQATQNQGQVSQPTYTQTTNNEVNQSISDVLQSAGVKTAGMETNIQTPQPVQTPQPISGTTDFDAGIKEEFSKSVIGTRVDLVTNVVSEASERFTFDKNLFKEDLKNLNYTNEDIELLMSNEELAIIAILDGKVRENLSQRASQRASQNGVLDYVSKYDTGRSVIELANGTVFDFLKEELAGVESGLDITTRSKLKRIFNDENSNKE